MNHIFLKYLNALFSTMPYKGSLVILLTFIASFTEGISLLMLVPLLQLVGINTQTKELSGFNEIIYSIFKTLNINPTLISILVIYVLIISTLALISFLHSVISQSVLNGFISHLKKDLYKSIINSSWLFITGSRLSDFTHSLTAEISRIGSGTTFLLKLTATTAIALVYFIIAFQLSFEMTSFILLLSILMLLFFKNSISKLYQAGRDLTTYTKSIYSCATEYLNSIKVIKSYGGEKESIDFFSQQSNKLMESSQIAALSMANNRFCLKVVSVIALSLVLFLSIEILKIKIAAAFLLILIFARLMPQMSSIQQDYLKIANMLPAFENITNIKDECTKAREAIPEHITNMQFEEFIKLENVFFSYPKRENTIFNVTLTLKKGEITALVGPSGAGKSTVADLITGLIQPDEGRILIDDIVLQKEFLKSWRSKIGYVTQDTLLFHDTIRENLLWANKNATEDDMNEALKLSIADEFISLLPNGINTIIGDHGVLLSGGQRQRIALARALIRRPLLLILDEATSFLDFESEYSIQRAIENLHKKMTILLITHRLQSARNADMIYVIEKGRIRESGTWDNLIHKENSYLQTQLKEELRTR